MDLAVRMAYSLTWWSYPVMFFVVFGSVWLAYRLENWRESKADPGPYPCLTHLGTAPGGWELWCWGQSGHVGPHDDPTAGPFVEPDQDDAPYDMKMCAHWESNLYCASVHGHDGPHDLRTA